ncbi:MAG TPA: hypothetical protein VGR43_11725 [Dehalococcoidia bacterium]|nr:hypothetical protein [Dehalococcoidia bacterium]
MKIVRYCGKERLPGGTRLWRRLARLVGFKGTLELYGYGIGGKPGRAQLHAYLHGERSAVTIGDYGKNQIRVWVRCSCSPVDSAEQYEPEPLHVFAHELGHYIQDLRHKTYKTKAIDEAVAERYGRWLRSKL